MTNVTNTSLRNKNLNLMEQTLLISKYLSKSCSLDTESVIKVY